MASRSHRPPVWQTLCAAGLVLALALALPALAAAGDGEEPAAAKTETPRTVTVGKAKITWHLPSKASARPTKLVTAFEKAAEAHLTGGELQVTPQAEPVTLPGGQLMFEVPVEMIHTMFVGPAGRPYCSDSTVAAEASAVNNSDGEAR